jgi:hypothetical protein
MSANPPLWQLVLLSVTYVVVLGVLAGVFLWLVDKIFRREPSRAEIDEHSRRHRERLLAPDFAALEAHFGTALPDALKRLYADKEEILRGERGDFEVMVTGLNGATKSWYIAFYEPADAQSLAESWEGCEPYFFFANDGCGNDYMIKPGLPDPEVLFHDHETGEIVQVAPSLTSFLASPKQIPAD